VGLVEQKIVFLSTL